MIAPLEGCELIEAEDQVDDDLQMLSPPLLLQAVVAIPVRNERERIGRCLEALADQQGFEAGGFGIVLFLNNCTDDTENVVASLRAGIAAPVRVIVEDYAHATAGWARRAAMEAAAQWLSEAGDADGVILTTDADSRVGPLWVRQNLAYIQAGADAVAGRIVLDADEAALLPAALHARGRLEGEYEALLTEIGARLDPESGNPWPCHWTTSGATLAVRRTTYLQVGGMPAMAVGEDRAFVAALRAQEACVRHAPDIEVVTSGRLDGRAPGGAADTIRLRSEYPNSPCDSRLEVCWRAVMRVAWRRYLRRLHAKGRLNATRSWAPYLAIAEPAAVKLSQSGNFGSAFAAIEATSPRLAFRPLCPSQLPKQIYIAKFCVTLLRCYAWLFDRNTSSR